MFVHWRFSNSFRGPIQGEFSYHGPWGLSSRIKELCYVYWNILCIRIFQTWEMLKNDQHFQLYILCTCRRICIYINKTHEKKTYIHTVDRQKIKPYRHLPNKTPHPKLQCWTKLYLTSSAFRICFFCPPVPSAQPKDNIKIFGAWGLTTIQQGFDFIVHLQYVNK